MAKDIPTDLLVDIVRRLLNVGVPPTAIANAFECDPEPIRLVAAQMRRETYGTAELSEAMQFMLWTAWEENMRLLRHGPPELRFKAQMSVLGKAMAASARQTPEEVQDLRAEFAKFTRDTAIAEASSDQEEYETTRGEYVAVMDADIIED